MRFAASPLLVAVALGLLGPAALEAEEEDFEERASDAPVTSDEAPASNPAPAMSNRSA